jgi:tRNA U34 2-thiouridine synthase MnmA/TrmU
MACAPVQLRAAEIQVAERAAGGDVCQRVISARAERLVRKQVGEHVGLAFYTLGQRKGLSIGDVKGRQQDDGTAYA